MTIKRTPSVIGPTDPDVARKLQANLKQASIIANGRPTVSNSELILPSTTARATANSLTLTTSANNQPSDTVTVYPSSGNVYVSTIDQTIQQTVVNQTGVYSIIAGNNVTITSTGVGGTGNVTINSSGTEPTPPDPTANGTFSTLPDFLQFVGGTLVRTGQTGEGVFFDSNAGDGDISYPVRTNFSIAGETKVTVTVDMVVNDECSDFGLCVFEDNESGIQPEWAWDPNTTRIAAQYDCTQPVIFTLNDSAYSGYDIPSPGTYRVRFTYDPNNSPNVTLETLDTSDNVLDTITIDGTLDTNNFYYIGFSADQDSTNLRTYIQNLIIDVDGGSTYTDSLQLSGGGANTGNVTFDNINIIGTGNLHLQPDPANSGSYLDIFLSSGPDIHIVASASANLILGKDDQSNVMTSWDGNVYIQSWDSNTNTQGGIWTFDGTGNLTIPGNIIIDNMVLEANIASDSNINIISNSYLWTFGLDGNTAFPTIGTADLGNLAIANSFSTNGAGGDLTLTGGNINGANVTNSNTFKSVATTVSALGSAATAGAGARAFVNDANLAASGNFGAVISGSGGNTVPVYSDGSNWCIG